MSNAAGANKATKKTLDIQHTNKLNEFQMKAERAASLKQMFNQVYEKVLELEAKKKAGEATAADIDDLISLCDERDTIKKAIEDLEANDDELDYLINTAPILFKYYDIVEKGSHDEIAKPRAGEKSILSFFMKNKEEPKGVCKEDRATLLEKYMSYTDENFIKPAEAEQNYKCLCCGCANMNILLNDGIIYCDDCSAVEYIIVDHDRPSYKDPPKEISYFSYKRINHFNESNITRIVSEIARLITGASRILYVRFCLLL